MMIWEKIYHATLTPHRNSPLPLTSACSSMPPGGMPGIGPPVPRPAGPPAIPCVDDCWTEFTPAMLPGPCTEVAEGWT